MSRKVKRNVAKTAGRDGQAYEVEHYGDGARATFRNNAGDAMNWLYTKGHLLSKSDGPKSDREREVSFSDATARKIAADELTVLFEKAELTPIRSPDPGGTPGGQFGPRYVGVSKIVAQMKVQDVRRDMPGPLMNLLERILLRNEAVWHGLAMRQQQQVFRDVRMALDFATWSLDKQDGPAAEARARALLCQKWEAAGEWFRQRVLRLAISQARIISRSGKRS